MSVGRFLQQAAAGAEVIEPLYVAYTDRNSGTYLYSIDEDTDAITGIYTPNTSFRGIAFSTDSKYVFCVNSSFTAVEIRDFDAQTGAIGSLITTTSAVTASSGCQIKTNLAALNDVGKHQFVFYTDNAYIYEFDGSSVTLKSTWSPGGNFRSINFSKDGAYICRGQYSGSVIYGPYSTSTGTVGTTITWTDDNSQHVCFSQGSGWLINTVNIRTRIFAYGATSGFVSSATGGSTGCDCNVDGLLAVHQGVSLFNESTGGTSAGATLPNCPAALRVEHAVSDSNNVNSNIRYVLAGSYDGGDRIYKVDITTSPTVTVTDLGTLTGQVFQANDLNFSR